MKVSYSNLNRLTRWEVFKFLDDVLNFAEAREEGLPELYLNKLAELRASFVIFDEALVQEGKTSPERLIEAEEKRDYAIRKIYSICREYSDYSFDEAKEDAANALLKLFKPYGTGSVISKMAQDAETAVLINLIQDFETQIGSESLAVLDLVGAFDNLKAANYSFDRKQQERSTSESEFVAGVVKKARNDVQDEFMAYADVVNALAIIEGEEKYIPLKNFVNTRLSTYVARAKQRTKKKEEETPEEVEK